MLRDLPDDFVTSARGYLMHPILSIISSFFLVIAMTTKPENAYSADPNNTLFMDLKYGRVIIDMRPDLAPKHVTRIKELVRQRFYDGLTFHRVIGGFMAQGGDPDGNGTGGSGVKLTAEFSNEPHVRGTVSMARSSDPNSGDSQFFIVFAQSPWLDGKYTVWGKVTSGMEYVGKLKRGSRADNGLVDQPDKILRVQIASEEK